MKKLFSFVVGVLLSSPLLSLAQDMRGDQELSASYGLESGTDIIRGFSMNRSRPDFDHSTYNAATAKTGNIFITYRYFINKLFDLGVTLGTEAVSFDYLQNTSPIGQPPILLGHYKATVTTLAFECKRVYYNGKLVQLYGLIGLGGRYYGEKEISGSNTTQGQNLNNFPTVFFNSQWTPIGVRVGKTLSGFAEIGVGYKGLANVGVSYRLCRKVVKPGIKQDYTN